MGEDKSPDLGVVKFRHTKVILSEMMHKNKFLAFGIKVMLLKIYSY